MVWRGCREWDWIAYSDFRDDNVRGWAAEFSRAVGHDMVGSAVALL